ncbi:MAG TPA: adenylate kinase [Candidatus Avimonoglobus intestinipullorum]|uniref:Adenylate kinase n=1 Tax=Candidatus Avimonoglobus intestinipullorum TaxID=2840699 RepID=A0A9D1LTW4_9FIRM|nr:adenylate kinase [Candidatus Avimonoglobus intestinipullorum]
MNLILLGPPGAGKGTQAEILSKRLGIETISTGVMLRTAIREGTELGTMAQEYINAGKLVPDDVVVGIVKERLSKDDCKKGFILDGFPRTTAQAEALEQAGVRIDKVLSLEVSDETIIERLSGRRECKDCGTPYHVVYKPSANGDKCQVCGGPLIQRADDNEETVKNRIQVYHEQTEPIKEFYQKQGKVVVAHGREELADTTREVAKALGLE